MKRSQKQKKVSFFSHIKTPQGLLILSLFLLIPFSIVFFSQQQKDTEKHVLAASTLTHFTGAFSVLSNYSTAAGTGVGAALDYGYNPVAGDTRSSDLQAANMQIIDQMPDEYLRQFDQDGNMTNLINSLTSHLQAEQNNSQIIAYWVLDDWSKDGTAKQALQQMTSLIHQYTPGKPSICGFSGNSGDLAGKTQNFSPQGCDMVAPYIYPNSDGDWTLQTVLPDIEAGLKSQGWDINTTPMVGVPQSYGGANNYAVPTAQQVETETKAFCQAGATGIIFYDFDTGQNPLNNADLLQGVTNGLDDCHTIWGTTTATIPQVSGGAQTSPAVSPPSLSPPTLFCMGSCPTTAPSLAPAQGTTVISGIPNIGTTTAGGFSMSSIMAMIQNLMGSMLGGMGFGSTGTGGGTTGGINMNNVSTGGNIAMPNVGGTGTTTTGGGGFNGLSGIGNMMSGLGNMLGL